MRNFKLQPKLRIMSDEITEGIDELGVLLMGHGLNALVDRLAARHPRDAPARAGPERDDAAGGGVGDRRAGVDDQEPDARASSCPTRFPYKEILDVAGAYLGPCPSVQTDWTPLQSRSRLFAKWGTPAVPEDDLWQFASFAVEA